MNFARSALLLAVVSTAAIAQPPGGAHHPPPLHEIVADRADELGLDDAVLAEIEDMFAENWDLHESLRAGLRTEHDAMREIMEADQPNRKRALNQVESIAAAELALHRHRISVELELRALLTPREWRALRPGSGR